MVLIPGASHFFDRLLTQMGEEITRALGPAARKETS